MSRQCLSNKQTIDRQRRGARQREWDSFQPEQRNLVIRRLATRKSIRRANLNAAKIAEETASGADHSE